VGPLDFLFWRQPESGSEPVREWLLALDKEDRGKIGFSLRKVQIGWPIGMPLSRPMGDGLHELRVSLKGRREARLLFCVHDEIIVGLHAFFKTTKTTPQGDLSLAKGRMEALK
jgi:phage-related protein